MSDGIPGERKIRSVEDPVQPGIERIVGGRQGVELVVEKFLNDQQGAVGDGFGPCIQVQRQVPEHRLGGFYLLAPVVRRSEIGIQVFPACRGSGEVELVEN